MKSIIFIAPPASGKGTFSSIICRKYNMPHISTGDLLRSASTVNDEKGIYIKEQMKKGAFIKDDILFDLIKERISRSDCNDGYILDGFPRNMEQAKVYDQILASLNKDLGCVIVLDIPKEIAKERIVGRVSCPKCGRAYNTIFDNMKPKVNNICDDCHSVLVKRDDDNAETYEVRYQTYLDKTEPLIEFYKNKGILYTIDTTIGTEETLKKIEEIIK